MMFFLGVIITLVVLAILIMIFLVGVGLGIASVTKKLHNLINGDLKRFKFDYAGHNYIFEYDQPLNVIHIEHSLLPRK